MVVDKVVIAAAVAAAKAAAVKAGAALTSKAAINLAGGALLAGGSAAIATANANAQARAHSTAAIAAMGRDREALAATTRQQAERERLAAVDFQRRQAVQSSNTLASASALGGVGQTGDILSALGTTQTLEAAGDTLRSNSIFDSLRQQDAELYRQQQGLLGLSLPSVAGAFAGGAARGLAQGVSSMPSRQGSILKPIQPVSSAQIQLPSAGPSYTLSYYNKIGTF
jgi:hypothetical protein